MKSCLLVLLFAGISLMSISDDVYRVLQSSSQHDLETVISSIDDTSTAILKGYKGTLLMRKAEFESTPKKKLDAFKLGHALLESAIASEPVNVELKLLRLMIQEHAPKVLKYNQSIVSDAHEISARFHSLTPVLQSRIKTYAKQSPQLKLEGF